MPSIVVLPIVFILLAAGGLGAFFGVGTPLNGSTTTNVIMILAGAATATLGTWAWRGPSGLTVSDSDGTDAFGMQKFGAPRAPRRGEIERTGLIFIVLGVLFEIFAVFVGAITG